MGVIKADESLLSVSCLVSVLKTELPLKRPTFVGVVSVLFNTSQWQIHSQSKLHLIYEFFFHWKAYLSHLLLFGRVVTACQL